MAEASLVSKCVAEFIGTYLLVFTVGCNVLSGNATWGGVSIGCVLMVAIYALASVSGANFNPAVSVTLGITKSLGANGMDWKDVAIYCGVQVIAGVCAGFSYFLLFGEVFNLAPAKGFQGLVPAAVCEILYTFMLCFVVLNVAASKGIGGGQNKFYGLAIGFVIVAGAYGAGAISGGCFNPAVAIGIDTSSAHLGFGWCGLYTVFELVGAGLAAGAFRVVRPGDFDSSITEVGLPAMLTSEFLGTFILVLTVGLNVCASSPAAAFSIAASLMCMIYSLGDVSGANFNPAVTVAILLAKFMPKSKDDSSPDYLKALYYILVQLTGGICAAFVYYGIACSFKFGPVQPHGWGSVAVAEIVFTFVLCFVVLGSACAASKNTEMFGLAIGSCVTVGGFAIGSISGGSLNPAVSCSLALVGTFTGGRFWEALVYSAFEIVGGVLAAGAFMVTHAAESEEGKEGEQKETEEGKDGEDKPLVDAPKAEAP